MTAWIRFCDAAKITNLGSNFQLSEMTNLCVAFIAFEVGIRGMSPWSIKRTYLSAISNGFMLRGITNNFESARKAPIVNFILRGYIKIYSQMHPAGEVKKLAFTIELVKYTDITLQLSSTIKYRSRMFIKAVKLAMTFGIYFLLRKSEFLPVNSAGKFHAGLQWENIRFFASDGIVIPWKSIGSISAKHLEIKIPISKTDQLGFGRLVKHERVFGPHCIVQKMEQWAKELRNMHQWKESDYLFHKVGSPSVLSDADVSAVMKSIVVHLGWDPKKICVHSLRYGGATMLASAGLPQYVIAYFGGWAEGSSALRRYIQVGGDSVAKVSKAMSEGFNKSIEESRMRAYSNQQTSDR